MDPFEFLGSQINEKVDKIVEDVEAFRLEMLRKIEDARNNEILSSIRELDNSIGKLSTRIKAIEERLPPEEDNG